MFSKCCKHCVNWVTAPSALHQDALGGTHFLQNTGVRLCWDLKVARRDHRSQNRLPFSLQGCVPVWCSTHHSRLRNGECCGEGQTHNQMISSLLSGKLGKSCLAAHILQIHAECLIHRDSDSSSASMEIHAITTRPSLNTSLCWSPQGVLAVVSKPPHPFPNNLASPTINLSRTN